MRNLEPDHEGALVDSAVAARALVRAVGPALDQFADQVWCFGLDTVPDPRRALGMVAQMAAELILGADALFEAGRFYTGASLVRQLIETDYLLFLFAIDESECERWLNGSTDEHKQLFMPGAMRKRAGGRFDVDEYARHCENGGHPRPAARALVDRHHLVSRDPSSVLWMDLAQHVGRVWGHYKAAVAVCSPTNVYPARFAPIDLAIEAWDAQFDRARAVLVELGALPA